MMIKGRTVGIFYSMSLAVAPVFFVWEPLYHPKSDRIKENSYSIATVDKSNYKLAALQKPAVFTEVR